MRMCFSKISQPCGGLTGWLLSYSSCEGAFHSKSPQGKRGWCWPWLLHGRRTTRAGHRHWHANGMGFIIKVYTPSRQRREGKTVFPLYPSPRMNEGSSLWTLNSRRAPCGEVASSLVGDGTGSVTIVSVSWGKEKGEMEGRKSGMWEVKTSLYSHKASSGNEIFFVEGTLKISVTQPTKTTDTAKVQWYGSIWDRP